MNKAQCLAALLCASSIPALAAQAPVSTPFSLMSGTHLRLLAKRDSLTHLLELEALGGTAAWRPKGITLGSHWRALTNLKFGAFYAMRFGERHDSDWTKESGSWAWRDTSGRTEHLVSIDIAAMDELDIPAGGNWTAELRFRLTHNSHENAYTLKARPGIRCFLLDGMDPWLSFFVQAELFFPMNYGVQPLNESWFYAGVLYAVSPSIEVGLESAIRTVNFGETPAFNKANSGQIYRASARDLELGLIAIWRLD